ncbi:MAG: ribonuclease Z [Flavobacteriaceae bacterium]|nr:ribonuclease Z [Flavobacteriaceae bacterium]
MKVRRTDTFVILEDERNKVSDFAEYLELIVPKKFEKDNLIINLLKYDEMVLDELLLFLKLSNYHRASKHSFVIANDAVNPDDVPFEMIVVPTLQEAEDIVGMEEIERDLGF